MKKSRKQLKDIGMLKEFDNWKKDISKKLPLIIEIGSKVRVARGDYFYSKPGSEGEVLGINRHAIMVKFNYLTSIYRGGKTPTFMINLSDLELIP